MLADSEKKKTILKKNKAIKPKSIKVLCYKCTQQKYSPRIKYSKTAVHSELLEKSKIL